MLARTTRLLLLVCAQAAAVALLVRLGSVSALALPHGDVGTWLRETPPTVALAAALRVVALAGAAWLLASTVLYGLTGLLAGSARQGSRITRARRGAGRLTHPAVRRLVDGALACALLTTAALAPRTAMAATASPTPTTTTTIATTGTTGTTPIVLEHPTRPGPPPAVRDGRAEIAALPAATTATTSTTEPASAPEHPEVPAPPIPAPAAPALRTATSHVVAPGEHLWAIAADRVAEAIRPRRAKLRARGDRSLLARGLRREPRDRALREREPDPSRARWSTLPPLDA